MGYLVPAAVAAAGGIGLTACSTEFTECYAVFSSRAAAEHAAADLRTAAPDLRIALDTERRGGGAASIFTTPASGPAARPLTSAFRRTVRAHEGTLGHPDDGCLEREPFM